MTRLTGGHDNDNEHENDGDHEHARVDDVLVLLLVLVLILGQRFGLFACSTNGTSRQVNGPNSPCSGL